MSKHKKRVSLPQQPALAREPVIQTTAPRASAAPTILLAETEPQAPPPDETMELPASDETPAAARIEHQPLFWFVLGALTVGIIVLLGLLLMNVGAASLSPLATPAGRAVAVATATQRPSPPPTATSPAVRPATATTLAAPSPTPEMPDFSAVMTSVAIDHASVGRINVAETKKLLDAGAAILIDVRSEYSYKEQHAKGAINVPPTDTNVELLRLPKDKLLILYCS